jgi:hypothetical protein
MAIPSRFEYLVQVGPLRFGGHKRRILFTWNIEIAIQIPAGAKPDLELPLSRQISDRSYARGTN